MTAVQHLFVPGGDMFTKETLFMYSKKILIVDDTPLFIKLAEDFFRREQVEILTAGNGQKAVEVIRKQQPDLVFMDLYMPIMDGDLACREIKQDYRFRSTPIIMVTSSNRPEDEERCRNAGCNDVIYKPLVREDFLKVSRRYITFPEWSGKRAKINGEAQFRTESGQPKTGTLYDISVGGLFLETEEVLPIDTILLLSFRLHPETALIQCQGRVAWVNKKFNLKKDYASTGLGIEFVDIKKMDLLNIQAWMRQAKKRNL